jgi:hypothetical protein
VQQRWQFRQSGLSFLGKKKKKKAIKLNDKPEK